MVDPKRWSEDEHAPPRAAAFLRQLERATPPNARTLATLAGRLSALSAGSAAAGVLPFAVKVGAVVGAFAASAGLVLALQETPTAPPARARPTVAARALSPARAAAIPPSSEPAAAPAPVAPVAARAVSKPRLTANTSGSARASARDTLAEEEKLLETARKNIASAPAQALRALDQHQRRFPTGELTPERLYLAADALRRLGDRSGARRKAVLLNQRYPSSVYARRLAPLLAEAQSAR